MSNTTNVTIYGALFFTRQPCPGARQLPGQFFYHSENLAQYNKSRPTEKMAGLCQGRGTAAHKWDGRHRPSGSPPIAADEKKAPLNLRVALRRIFTDRASPPESPSQWKETAESIGCVALPANREPRSPSLSVLRLEQTALGRDTSFRSAAMTTPDAFVELAHPAGLPHQHHPVRHIQGRLRRFAHQRDGVPEENAPALAVSAKSARELPGVRTPSHALHHIGEPSVLADQNTELSTMCRALA